MQLRSPAKAGAHDQQRRGQRLWTSASVGNNYPCSLPNPAHSKRSPKAEFSRVSNRLRGTRSRDSLLGVQNSGEAR